MATYHRAGIAVGLALTVLLAGVLVAAARRPSPPDASRIVDPPAHTPLPVPDNDEPLSEDVQQAAADELDARPTIPPRARAIPVPTPEPVVDAPVAALTRSGQVLLVEHEASHVRTLTSVAQVAGPGELADTTLRLGGWSHDGRLLIVEAVRGTSQRPRGRDLVVVDRTGSIVLRRSEAGTSHAWSPDSTQVASIRSGGIDIIDVASGRLVRRLDDVGVFEGFSSLAWSQVTGRLAVTGTGTGTTRGIFAMDADGTRLRHLVEAGYENTTSALRWGTGGALLFGDISSDGGVFTTTDGPDRSRLTSGEVGFGANWSPDGTHVVYLNRDPTNDPAARARVWEPRTGITRTVGPDQTTAAAFTSGGRVALIHSGQLWVVDADSRNLRQWTAFEDDALVEISPSPA